MDLTFDDSLNTTTSSLDLGTTLDESFSIVTSTPLKSCDFPIRQVVPGSPPPKPTAPKPRTVIRRRSTRGANMLSCPPATIAIEGRLRSMSFKRRMLKVRLDQLQNRTNSLKIRDQQIIRRHTALCQEISRMVDDCGEDSLDCSHDSTPTKRLKTGSMSYSNIIPFERNSVTRRPRPRKSNRYPSEKVESQPVESVAPSHEQVVETDTNPKTPIVGTTPTVISPMNRSFKQRQKVRKPPSLRFKRFVQKKFGKALNQQK